MRSKSERIFYLPCQGRGIIHTDVSIVGIYEEYHGTRMLSWDPSVCLWIGLELPLYCGSEEYRDRFWAFLNLFCVRIPRDRIKNS